MNVSSHFVIPLIWFIFSFSVPLKVDERVWSINQKRENFKNTYDVGFPFDISKFQKYTFWFIFSFFILSKIDERVWFTVVMNVSEFWNYLIWFTFSLFIPWKIDERVWFTVNQKKKILNMVHIFLWSPFKFWWTCRSKKKNKKTKCLIWFTFSFGLPLFSDERVVTFCDIPNMVHVSLWSPLIFWWTCRSKCEMPNMVHLFLWSPLIFWWTCRHILRYP